MDSFCFLPFQYAICPPLQTTWNSNSGMIIIQMHVTKNEMWHSGAAIRHTDRLQIFTSGRTFTSSSNEPGTNLHRGRQQRGSPHMDFASHLHYLRRVYGGSGTEYEGYTLCGYYIAVLYTSMILEKDPSSIFIPPWRWRQKAPSKRWYLSTKLQVLTSQKTQRMNEALFP